MAFEGAKSAWDGLDASSHYVDHRSSRERRCMLSHGFAASMFGWPLKDARAIRLNAV
jgi:hypothetical protein